MTRLLIVLLVAIISTSTVQANWTQWTFDNGNGVLLTTNKPPWPMTALRVACHVKSPSLFEVYGEVHDHSQRILMSNAGEETHRVSKIIAALSTGSYRLSGGSELRISTEGWESAYAGFKSGCSSLNIDTSQWQ